MIRKPSVSTAICGRVIFMAGSLCEADKVLSNGKHLTDSGGVVQ